MGNNAFRSKISEDYTLKKGHVGWRCPSNLAIIKYWGKHGQQLPQNPSISLTLSNAFTETIVNFELMDYESEEPSIEFYFDSKPNESFQLRIQSFLSTLNDYFPYLSKYHLSIESQNSFPHSSGIASSASSMAALALCLCSIEDQLSDEVMENKFFLNKASFISRLGSGSACRSLYPDMAIWGFDKNIEAIIHNTPSDQYAIPYTQFHQVFKNYHDDILIVSNQEKGVSSTQGHRLMEDHPFAKARYDQARHKIILLLNCLESGDLWGFGKIAEEEALTLHGLMMCSDPAYMLIEPLTIELIKKIRNFRQRSNLPLFFSLDAGPNIHLLYPDEISDKVNDFVNNDLRSHCLNGLIINDKMGQGPEKIESFSI